MKRVFQPQNTVDFLTEIGFDKIEFLEETNGVLDYQLERKGKKYYAYASNYSMSAYNEDGVMHNFSKFWQDFLCDNVDGYPNLLIKHLEQRKDDAVFLYKRKQEWNENSQQDRVDFYQLLEDYDDRISSIKDKYNLNGRKK